MLEIKNQNRTIYQQLPEAKTEYEMKMNERRI
jgi:hypothetical protein